MKLSAAILTSRQVSNVLIYNMVHLTYLDNGQFAPDIAALLSYQALFISEVGTG